MTVYRRTLLPYFQIANYAYAGATISVYEVDPDTNESTGILAALYTDISGSNTASNPYTLGTTGQFTTPIYIEKPVVIVTNPLAIPSHESGIVFPDSGTYRGEWSAATEYLPGDLIKDGAAGSNTGDIYVSSSQHTSGSTFSTDVSAGKWDLMIDVSSILTDATTLAASYATSAADSATQAAAYASAAQSAAVGYFTVTDNSVPVDGINLYDTHTMGIFSNSIVQAVVKQLDADNNHYIVMSGGSDDGVKGHVYYTADGELDDITLRFHAKGKKGQIHFYQGHGGVTAGQFVQFNVGGTWDGDEVFDGYLNATGSHDGGNCTLSSQGTSSVNGIDLYTHGTGGFGFYTDNYTLAALTISRVASAVSHLRISPAATGNPALIEAVSSDSNAGITITPKGTGVLSTKSLALTGSTIPDNGIYLTSSNTIGLAANSAKQVNIIGIGDAVNYIGMAGSTTGNSVYMAAGGSDTNIDMCVVPKGNGGLGVGFNGAVTGKFHVIQDSSGVAIATFRDSVQSADLTVIADAGNEIWLKSGVADTIRLASAGGAGFSINSSGDPIVGTAALATTATHGMLWIPSCPGVPSGSLTAPYTGAVALIYDSTNNKIYANSGGTWRATGALT